MVSVDSGDERLWVSRRDESSQQPWGEEERQLLRDGPAVQHTPAPAEISIFIAEQSAPAPHLATPEGRATLTRMC